MRIIESYYRERGIEVVGQLAKDIETNVFKALRHVEYAIDNLASVPGIDELLRDIAKIEKAARCTPSNWTFSGL